MEPADDLAIQGNAVAGSPDNMFAVDVTAAEVTCAACGATSPLADEKAYLHGCDYHCSSVLGRFKGGHRTRCGSVCAPRQRVRFCCATDGLGGRSCRRARLRLWATMDYRVRSRLLLQRLPVGQGPVPSTFNLRESAR